MKYIIFDTEVFAHDNVAVFKDYQTGVRAVYHNDNCGVLDYITSHEGYIFVGANVKHYDQYIIKAMVNDFSPEEINQLNDFIIRDGHNGWEYPMLRDFPFYLPLFDVFDDMQQGLSLKSIEAHLGMNIEETEVDFDLPRKLTKKELALTVRYCSYDVDATLKLFDLRKDYRLNKLNLGQMAGMSPEKALRSTNASLTAEYLHAEPKSFDDERDYKYPDNLKKEFIPDEVFSFFDRLYDKSIPDEELFKEKYDSSVGNCSYTLGFGGIHGDCGTVTIESSEEEKLANDDVSSYYPHLMTINGYCSRAIPEPKLYSDMLERRMKAKKSGDKATNAALKLVANTTYGAMLAKWNKLYDAKMGRSVCISGQLYLLELAYHLHSTDAVSVVQMNTDGIMYLYRTEAEKSVNEITAEWQRRTGFELERDYIKKVIQKDVNNYIEVKSDGSVKAKGGYLVRGIAPAGAFNINNNCTIVSKAVIDYFTKGIPPETTINTCEDILAFQLIAKASGKYSKVFQLVDGQKVTRQRVNRVYASKRHNDGTLYKIHRETGQVSKIPSLPEHCLIDNKNEMSVDSVNKEWYIDKARKYIADFTGNVKSKPKKNTRMINKKKKEILKILEV